MSKVMMFSMPAALASAAPAVTPPAGPDRMVTTARSWWVALLVGGVHEREQKTDGQRLHLLCLEHLDGFVDRCLVERHARLALRSDTLDDLGGAPLGGQ